MESVKENGKKEVGQRLKRYLKSHGITGSRLARELGITQSVFSKIQSGINYPQSMTLQALGGWGLNVDWLLLGRGSMEIEEMLSNISPSSLEPTPQESPEELVEDVVVPSPSIEVERLQTELTLLKNAVAHFRRELKSKEHIISLQQQLLALK